MPLRTALYHASDAIEALFHTEAIEEMVKRTVDRAYDKNLTIADGVFVWRFNAFTVGGKVVSGSRLLESLATADPKNIGQVLPLVLLTEENGRDQAVVCLQSEISEFYPDGVPNNIREFISQPPNITVEQLLADNNRGKQL